ncbi:sulfite exporter TauE/SafE family protein [Treponema zioleckii]|uniref:sulfite exporter TauE/SafE family protein n=1 Tax=Treponema zioleckii TaxID=331680 RepID=UPI00168ABB08|nr:TSUP family transporter [Treponema zioleckii]
MPIYTFLIVCPLLFVAGFVDSIAGGGLISLPAYLLAGLPIHSAIATNKFSSAFGTALTTARFIKERLVVAKLAVPSLLCGFFGAAIGARLSLYVPENVLKSMLLGVLPLAAFCVLNRKIFKADENAELKANSKTFAVVMTSALVIGCYDGLYGPGTGTFLIIAFTALAKMPVKNANAHTKVINLATNVSSLVVFLIHGQVLIPLGIVAAASNMLGNYFGSGLVMTKGSKIVKPLILVVLTLLLAKIIMDFS